MNEVLSAQSLRTLRCTHLSGQQRMDAQSVAAQCAVLPRWTPRDEMLVARFDWPDWLTTLAFVNALGWMAHEQDHHPDLLISYSSCEVRWTTHSAGGISLNDFICAARVDALLPSVHDSSSAQVPSGAQDACGASGHPPLQGPAT